MSSRKAVGVSPFTRVAQLQATSSTALWLNDLGQVVEAIELAIDWEQSSALRRLSAARAVAWRNRARQGSSCFGVSGGRHRGESGSCWAGWGALPGAVGHLPGRPVAPGTALFWGRRQMVGQWGQGSDVGGSTVGGAQLQIGSRDPPGTGQGPAGPRASHPVPRRTARPHAHLPGPEAGFHPELHEG